MYGGSIAAILRRAPGTPAAAATVVDGYPMARAGHAGRALGYSLSASLVGGLVSAVVLLTVAPMLGRLVLNFGPVEIFAIAVLGITIIALAGLDRAGADVGRARPADRHDRHGPDDRHAALHLRQSQPVRRGRIHRRPDRSWCCR
ncbi:tripartite tricarboxylate transporter permease [Limimaricola sp. ASW11-118]|uniref:Tripartite tricarboxylate transporter permease n=1 Tax=Limimaricola litoreus TaxID=2955316 RepID=A0A9X2JP64_9RHOB|nr:tripartite tricarboxylate transporter permease [Limimaricola litoreus]MCP1168449.1 tripartite tricarboxylate transporter permease [Limimaricola litoreus]